MQRFRTVPLLPLVLMAGLLLGVVLPSASAQDLVLEGRGPRFLAVPVGGSTPVEVDASRSAVLRRVVSLKAEHATVGGVLRAIEAQTGLKFVYSRAVVPVDRRVGLRAESITVAAALTEVLLDAKIDVVLSPDGQFTLVARARDDVGAQMGAIVGRVTDANTGEGLSGADVLVEGTRWRGSTGADGRYRIAAVEAGSYTLAVRRIGYRRESRPVTVGDGDEVTVDVALEPQPTQLDEVVTTVTGEQRLRELGHVVGRINADSLVKEAPISNLSELLTGRVPGLQVFQSQGTVGGEVRLQVRGANSPLLGTEPIIIVDGVRYTNGAARRTIQASGVSSVESTSPLNDLNPNDIETIEVVKGPSAATLYGTDAANGVLVITTKRGRPGPARWNVYAKGMTTATPAETYPDLYWGWGTVFGVPNNPTFSCYLPYQAAGLCTLDSIAVLPNPLNDPQLSVLQSARSWGYGANVAGGRQDLRYYFSGDLQDATGPIKMPLGLTEQLMQERGLSELPEEWREPNALTKLNLRANVAATLGDAADLRVHTGYVRDATRTLGLGNRNPYAEGAFRSLPGAPYGTSFLSFGNPTQSFAQSSTERTDRFFGSASGQWRPGTWLAMRATVGLDLSNRNRYSLARRGDAPDDFAAASGAVGDDRIRQVTTTAELGATATVRMGRFSTRTALGVQYVRSLDDALSSYGTNLPPGGSSIGEAASVQTRQTYQETATLGSYFEETLGLNERLFVTGALRVDGASTFGQDYDATVYPKVGVSWLVSEEPFLPRVSGLDELRLRYAYGASGQQPLPEWTRPAFGTGQAVRNGTVTTVVNMTSLGNPLLRPQRVREHELGLDATALQGRVQLSLTWDRRRTVDQITPIALPAPLGTMYTNLGLTTQHGFEAQLTAHLVDTRFLSWNLSLQHSLHRTKLVDLGGGVAQYGTDGGYVEGYSLGARFMAQMVGYTDANGDGIVNQASEVQMGDTAIYVGESIPPRSQTLTTVLGLFERRLRLSALIERRSGFTVVNQVKYRYCAIGRCPAAVDPTIPLSEQSQVAALGKTPLQAGQAGAYFTYVEPGNFTRLRELTAALDLPAGVVRALRVRSATLSLSARNVALWTKFSGPDPESAAVSGAGGGVAEGGIPQGRSWSLRLDLGL